MRTPAAYDTSELPELEDGGYGHGPVEDYAAPRYPWSGRVALLTGASQGIGRHVAVGLARCGASVVPASRSKGGPETAEMIASHATKQTLLPEDCIAPCLFMLSDGAFFSVGPALMIDGGYTAR